MKKIISIEGNIGSGKSTFLQYLKEHLTSDKICFLDEPVDDWLSIVDTNDKNIIERYYDDQKKYAFSFQMMAYISRLSLLKKALQNNI
jgi:deoxyadenosine/deoxycytidine kinase